MYYTNIHNIIVHIGCIIIVVHDNFLFLVHVLKKQLKGKCIYMNVHILYVYLMVV